MDVSQCNDHLTKWKYPSLFKRRRPRWRATVQPAPTSHGVHTDPADVATWSETRHKNQNLMPGWLDGVNEDLQPGHIEGRAARSSEPVMTRNLPFNDTSRAPSLNIAIPRHEDFVKDVFSISELSYNSGSIRNEERSCISPIRSSKTRRSSTKTPSSPLNGSETTPSDASRSNSPDAQSSNSSATSTASPKAIKCQRPSLPPAAASHQFHQRMATSIYTTPCNHKPELSTHSVVMLEPDAETYSILSPAKVGGFDLTADLDKPLPPPPQTKRMTFVVVGEAVHEVQSTPTLAVELDSIPVRRDARLSRPFIESLVYEYLVDEPTLPDLKESNEDDHGAGGPVDECHDEGQEFGSESEDQDVESEDDDHESICESVTLAEAENNLLWYLTVNSRRSIAPDSPTLGTFAKSFRRGSVSIAQKC